MNELIKLSSTNIKKANECLKTWLMESCHSEESRYNYKLDINHFAGFLKEIKKDFFETTKKDIVTYLEFLRTQSLSPATRSKKLTVLKGLIRNLALESLFPNVEAEKILKIKAPRVSRDGRTPGLSTREARKLLNTPDPESIKGIRDRAILSVLLYTGARVSALCNIKVGHLLHERGIFYILLHEKGGRKIRAPLHPEASERIQIWLDKANITDEKKGFLFRPFNNKGNVIQSSHIHRSTIFQIVKKYARKAGLQVDRMDERGICVHSTRVTAITSSFKGGAKLEEIQQLVGHKDPRNTLRYRQSSPKDAQNAVMRINY